MKTFLRLIISVAVPLILGGLSGVFTSQSIETWYRFLKKPPFTPPSWIFAPVWIFLYITMGLAAFLIWNKGIELPDVKTALAAFLVQLALNFSWSLVFFGLRSPLGGLIVIAALWLAIVVTIILFWRVSPVPGLILIPYLLWVSFASYLNFAIWMINSFLLLPY